MKAWLSSVSPKRGIRVLDLSGNLTLSTIEDLKRKVNEATNNGEEEIILDFRTVDLVDSSGLGAVISCYVTLQRKRKKLALVNLNERIKEIFLYTHLSKIITIYNSLEEVTT